MAAIAGSECSRVWRVDEKDTAARLRERGILVLSTPSLLKMLEVTARECVDSRLPEGEVTVGTLALVRHLAPAPVGSEVEVKVRVASVEGRRVTVYGSARIKGNGVLVGEFYHERRIVDLEDYAKRVRGS